MFKLLVITVIVLYLMRFFWHLMYPRMPKPPQALEVKACEYCGVLLREDRGRVQRGRFFCTADHAKRYFV